VQTILSDYKCQEFLFLIQNVRSLDGMSNQDIIRYRREAEGLVGAEDPLYKIEWVSPYMFIESFGYYVILLVPRR
jgi:paired amphipathic helix protein Sin3a